MLARMTEYIFFYGTLWTGTGNPRIDALVRAHCRVVARGRIRGRLYDLGDYPGVVATERARERVFGMVYSLRDAGRCLPELDRYEDYDPAYPERGAFVRRMTRVTRADRRGELDAWVYFLNRRIVRAPRILSGDYCRHRSRR
jgi:gamma-glutamylcyclotransferase (GGCT)/AIG2-like uncharacterized protein YtfP